MASSSSSRSFLSALPGTTARRPMQVMHGSGAYTIRVCALTGGKVQKFKTAKGASFSVCNFVAAMFAPPRGYGPDALPEITCTGGVTHSDDGLTAFVPLIKTTTTKATPPESKEVKTKERVAYHAFEQGTPFLCSLKGDTTINAGYLYQLTVAEYSATDFLVHKDTPEEHQEQRVEMNLTGIADYNGGHVGEAFHVMQLGPEALPHFLLFMQQCVQQNPEPLMLRCLPMMCPTKSSSCLTEETRKVADRIWLFPTGATSDALAVCRMRRQQSAARCFANQPFCTEFPQIKKDQNNADVARDIAVGAIEYDYYPKPSMDGLLPGLDLASPALLYTTQRWGNCKLTAFKEATETVLMPVTIEGRQDRYGPCSVAQIIAQCTPGVVAYRISVDRSAEDYNAPLKATANYEFVSFSMPTPKNAGEASSARPVFMNGVLHYITGVVNAGYPMTLDGVRNVLKIYGSDARNKRAQLDMSKFERISKLSQKKMPPNPLTEITDSAKQPLLLPVLECKENFTPPDLSLYGGGGGSSISQPNVVVQQAVDKYTYFVVFNAAPKYDPYISQRTRTSEPAQTEGLRLLNWLVADRGYDKTCEFYDKLAADVANKNRISADFNVANFDVRAMFALPDEEANVTLAIFGVQTYYLQKSGLNPLECCNEERLIQAALDEVYPARALYTDEKLAADIALRNVLAGDASLHLKSQKLPDDDKPPTLRKHRRDDGEETKEVKRACVTVGSDDDSVLNSSG